MAKERNKTGSRTSLWARVARLSGFSSMFGKAKRTARAAVQRRSVRKRNKRGQRRRSAHPAKTHRRKIAHRKTRRHARSSVHHRAAVKAPGSSVVPVRDVPVQREPRTVHLPRPHLPKVLFTEIHLPDVRLPIFRRTPRAPKADGQALVRPMLEIPEADAATEQDRLSEQDPVIEDDAKTDLADLLAGAGEEPAKERQRKKDQRKSDEEKPTAEDVGASFINAEISAEKEEKPKKSETQQSKPTATVPDAVLRKRKQSQVMEMVVQSSKTTAAETKAEKKKEKKKEPEATEMADPEEVLRTLEARAVRKKRKGLSTFFRSINYIGMGKYRSIFVQNMAMMLDAGLPLIESLQTIKTELKSRSMRTIVERILDLVESGHPLWVSMDEQGLFSPYEISLVRVGEEAGNLARNMEYLSVQQEKDHNLRQKVKMAMIYPTIVLVLMFIVVMGLGMFVLPNLIQVLYSLNVELPLSTRLVILFTEFMTMHGFKTGGSVILAFLVLFFLTKYTPFRAVTQWVIFHIPGIGRLAREASIARFGVILGGLLQAGVPLVESMESMVEVTSIVSFRRFYRKLLDRIVVGDSFATCFHSIRRSRKVLPASVQQLIITGEKSGALSTTCLKVASIYEKKAEETAEKLPVILEPALLLIIGSLVGFIAFSIIVPIYSAVGNVSGIN